MKKMSFILLSILLIFAVYLSFTTFNSGTPTAVAKYNDMKTYQGTVYIAGMGGHFAKADIEIDPASDTPIKVKELDRLVIGDKDTHPVHETRIDAADRNRMYWSTYKTDKKSEGQTVHVGTIDLVTETVILDKKYQLPDRAVWTGALYCSSGQTATSYMPATMTNDGYLSIYDKKTLDLKRTVYFDSIGYRNNYQFLHGTNSPDMKTYVLTVNKSEEWIKPDAPANRLGQIDMLLLDLPSLEEGKLKILTKNTITGSPENTITFRQRFTQDGKYLLQSGADRFFLLKGDDMKLLDEEMINLGENHDAIPTPDGKYAILTLRSDMTVPDGKGGDTKIKDGTLLLYDVEARKVIGKPSSVCYSCHVDAAEEGKPVWSAVLCGADVNWK
ncbi:MAG: hypothetical protein AB1499_12525 [Nitrospirota bacterium]